SYRSFLNALFKQEMNRGLTAYRLESEKAEPCSRKEAYRRGIAGLYESLNRNSVGFGKHTLARQIQQFQAHAPTAILLRNTDRNGRHVSAHLKTRLAYG